MKIYGKHLSEYIAFLKGPLILLVVMFIVRWIITAAHLGYPLDRLLSMSAVCSLLVVYLPFKVHIRKFGGYPQLGVLFLITLTWFHVLVVIAILLAAATRQENIYSLAEHFGHVPTHTSHILNHLTLGIGLFTLLDWGIGSLILYLLRRLDSRA